VHAVLQGGAAGGFICCENLEKWLAIRDCETAQFEFSRKKVAFSEK
jgi:hypothetical protein